MDDQKWNKNALGYGEKDKAISQDQWNKNALNYDPNEKIDIDIKNNRTIRHSKDQWNKNAVEYGTKEVLSNNEWCFSKNIQF